MNNDHQSSTATKFGSQGRSPYTGLTVFLFTECERGWKAQILRLWGKLKIVWLVRIYRVKEKGQWGRRRLTCGGRVLQLAFDSVGNQSGEVWSTGLTKSVRGHQLKRLGGGPAVGNNYVLKNWKSVANIEIFVGKVKKGFVKNILTCNCKKLDRFIEYSLKLKIWSYM